MKSSGDRELSTTMALVAILGKIFRDKEIAPKLVPIIPDEARTFGMEGFFQKVGIYAHEGQKYQPVDSEQLSSYREDQSGQVLEEGITEAGAMSSFIAAGTAYTNHDIEMMPFYIFYSMFGFQRVMDLAWAAGDSQTRGFLIGATSGRTTLAGEGLQHQDGQGLIMASMIPNCISYDPTYAYEMATIIEDGIKKMYVDQKNYFYYITTTNENYLHPKMPKGSKDGIIQGMHKIISSKNPQVRLLGSGSILRECMKANEELKKINIETEVWSVTSFNMLRKDGMETDRYNQHNPTKKQKTSYVKKCFKGKNIPVIASTDYVRSYADQIRPYIEDDYFVLGTDGYGRSDTREKLRDFFEIDYKNIIRITIFALYKNEKITQKTVLKIFKDLKIQNSKPHPWEI